MVWNKKGQGSRKNKIKIVAQITERPTNNLFLTKLAEIELS
jgi:hypothetical protein